MNKKEIIRKAAASSGESQQNLYNCLEILLKTMSEELNDGHSLTFSNFGTFKVKESKGRYVRNPKNGQTSFVSSYKKISFKPSPGIYRKNKE